jgi:cyclopropane fatty-acyl-phospholipid synthase-like methyltransferase
MTGSRIPLFDRWADRYDESVREATGVHRGYDQVLDLVVELADTSPGMSVLDLGIGTGNLAQRFVDQGCKVWGTDFSPAMLDKARSKLPHVCLVEADLRQAKWPPALERRFDRIVSTYVLHEFDPQTKVRLLRRLAGQHMAAGGRIVVGDIAFANRQDLQDAGAERWDEDEFYWVADETIAACAEVGLCVTYRQVSSCGGVFAIDRMQ